MTMSAELYQKRLENLRKWAADAGSTKENVADSAVGLGDWSWEPDDVEPFNHHYLVFTVVLYDGEPDESSAAGVDDLAKAAEEVAGHVFEKTREDYDNVAYVVDLDTGSEVEWDTEEKVVFKAAAPATIDITPVGVEKDPARVARAQEAWHDAQVETLNLLLQFLDSHRAEMEEGLCLDNDESTTTEEMEEIDNARKDLAARQEEFLRAVAGQ
jgi:hypothetical protein